MLKVKEIVSDKGGNHMDIKVLKDQIWTTRVSRINAERRLVKKEKFIQGIN